jgi:DNA-binding response OmpR family regulator
MYGNILVVDDDKLTCWGLEKIISSRDIFVTIVNNGRDALTEAGIRNYTSVFLDINLPDIRGFDVMREIRKMSPDTKIIIMTADDSDANRQRAFEEGAFYFVGKPFGMKEIKYILDSCLEEDPRKDVLI